MKVVEYEIFNSCNNALITLFLIKNNNLVIVISFNKTFVLALKLYKILRNSFVKISFYFHSKN